MKILIAGGSGFIGSHIVDDLSAKGHDLHVISRRETSKDSLSPRVHHHQGSLGDKALLVELLPEIDAVIHTASSTVPSTSNENPVGDVEDNLISCLTLLEAMRSAECKKLLFLSSGGTVYGIPEQLPVPETHPLRPICSYGVVKVAIENYLFLEQKLHGLQPVVIRPSNPYGPRQSKAGLQGVITAFLRNILAGKPIEIWGDGSVVRDYLYIDDLVALCEKAITSSETGIFNAGFGRGHSLLELITEIEAVHGQSIDPIFKDSRNFDIPRSVLDIAKTQKTFDWSPQTELRRGIEQTYRYLQSGASSW
ncbi:NAD-dependent epimerase/dehydratase family protein [Cohaesibacter intestini]|uniref:NAD-dependent epimerase/dehydratase family protein n=1 Tax=Cohaesibacter intestini TaxID=2211145 RepID=UPI000DE813AA|nr:NAD-dependent epimerase/dehydratase family protein [Cohaesibacter intestini]